MHPDRGCGTVEPGRSPAGKRKGVLSVNDRYVLLTEKEEMWARMLMEVLEDNGVHCAALPVYGAGFSVHTGLQERWNVFVSAGDLPRTEDLLQELFSVEDSPEEA